MLAYESGGPNDPRTAFNHLREQLTLLKDELSPYGWRAYANEFRDKQRAEKKLHALNRLPGSGVEPKDGMFEGTPLWQERLDKMMLIEHLKKKLMFAHGLFAGASEAMLSSHAWLVKDDLLGDPFVKAITHVPPSQFEQVDVLQEKLEEARKREQALEDEIEDMIFSAKRNRELHLQRITVHQKRQNDRKHYDDVLVSWAYRIERIRALDLQEAKRVLEARVLTLECSAAARADEHEESVRQWNFDMDVMTRDRDKFRKLYDKMVRAHEQALEDLKNSADTAEGRAKMIQVLTVEKARLTDEVEELEARKKELLEGLAAARVEIAKLNKEMRRRMEQFRETEELVLELRLEVKKLEGVHESMQAQLDVCAALEGALRDDLAVARGEILLQQAKAAEVWVDLGAEERIRRSVEAERDGALAFARQLETDIVANNLEHARVLTDVKERAAKELRETVEQLASKHAELMSKLERRNKLLEREVAIGDEIGQHLPVLNPLLPDDGYLCRVCRKTIIFEAPRAGPELESIPGGEG